jgi:glycosyltransferase involved in cell wall biosynthesis
MTFGSTSRTKRAVLFNWRDLSHPKAGGAEIYTDSLLRVLADQGFECTWFASASPGQSAYEKGEKYEIVRRGSELTCRFEAFRWLRERRSEIDLVIDEVNTLPWLSPFVRGPKVLLLMHQLAREVWWKEAPLAVAACGYVLEPLAIQIYRSTPVITLSKSSAESFRRFGIGKECYVIEAPLEQAEEPIDRPRSRSIGYVGRVTASKRIEDIIRAFRVVHDREPESRLVIVGKGTEAYVRSLHRLAASLDLDGKVEFTGRVSDQERDTIMASLDCLVMASLREGWGLVVSEAARFNVPCVAYDVPGLRDSIEDGISGKLVPNSDWRSLGNALASIVSDPVMRNRLGAQAAIALSRYSAPIFEANVKRMLEATGF